MQSSLPFERPWPIAVWEALIYATCHNTATDPCEAAQSLYKEYRVEHSAGYKKGAPGVVLAMLHVCAETKQVQGAVDLLNELQKHGSVALSPRIWGALLRVCAEAGDSKQAREFLNQMMVTNDSVVANVRHCTAYLKALMMDKQARRAAEFLEHMVDVAVDNSAATHIAFSNLRVAAPDMIAVKTVLSGCASLGEFKVARDILEQIKAGFFGQAVSNELDEWCYNTVLSACDDPVEAKALVREMRLTRRYRVGVIPPTARTYTKAIHVCRTARDVECARFFLDSARNDGFEPDMYMYSAGKEEGPCAGLIEKIQSLTSAFFLDSHLDGSAGTRQQSRCCFLRGSESKRLRTYPGLVQRRFGSLGIVWLRAGSSRCLSRDVIER